METKDEIKLYKDAGFKVNDVRSENSRVEELARLREEHGFAHKVTENDIKTNPDAGLVVGEWVIIPNAGDDTDTPNDTDEDSTDALDKSTDEEEDKATGDVALFFRGKAVVRVENRVQNGRVYKQVQVTDATYLVSEAEYIADLISK